MLLQERLIERVRELCLHDDRLVAAMMYGSFTQGEGDEYSDVEFVLFFEDEALASVAPCEWVGRVAPVELCFVNEFGNLAVVWESLVRGEFHFDPASRMGVVEGWRDTAMLPSVEAALILDRTGELTRRLAGLVGSPVERGAPEQVQSLLDSYLNWMLFGCNVLARGEHARALELLGAVGRYLLWMARLQEGCVHHWPTPSRALEADLSPESYGRYAACTARLDPAELRAAHRSAWTWGVEMATALAAEHGLDPRVDLLDRIGERVEAATSINVDAQLRE